MKKLLLSLVAAMIATVSFAQSSLLATLSHEGTVKTYYGASALRSAHENAVHGDVITLSSGTFLATDITKALTIRGAGMDSDSLSLREPTIITGSFTINIPNSISERLTLEGVYHNHTIKYLSVVNPMFLKCRFKEFTLYGSGFTCNLLNATFIHCKIADELYLNGSSTASLLSCVISHPSNSSSSSSFEFTNCIIKYNSSNANFSIYNSSLKNCYIYNKYGSNGYGFSDSNTLFNNVSNSSYSFKNCPNSTNIEVSLSSVFKSWTSGEWDDVENFELTDEAKTMYLGTDGTQIGIYGGNLPFESTPSNPQITKCTVAPKSTADGKLSVDITIKAAE